MKRIFFLMVFICTFFVFSVYVNAESFVEGSFISGEYINKVKNNKTYYMTMQYIKDSNGNIVYCLEPFTSFEEGKNYTEYESDLTGYKNLTSEQKRKIELIIYYGYGYSNRTSSKWYVITQYLIWKTVDDEADIYFTSSLNGSRITKYESEIDELLGDVTAHDIKPSFVKNYTINLNDEFVIDGFTSDYEVVSSSYNYERSNNKIVFNNVNNSGTIQMKRVSNFYEGNVVIFDSADSQDLIRPGNVKNDVYTISVNVLKGNIILDIKGDDSVYTVESSLEGTCYEITDGVNVIETVCTKDEELTYKTDDLPFGEYEIKQVSVGIGYKNDEQVYKVIINENNPTGMITLYNLLIKNKIEIIKYACKDQICAYEEGAEFEIKDINGDVAGKIITVQNGYGYITLGYGSYNVAQVDGASKYSFSESYTEKIVDEVTEHKKELYDYYEELEEETVIIEEDVNEEEVVESPPDTGIDDFLVMKDYLLFLLEIFKKNLLILLNLL